MSTVDVVLEEYIGESCSIYAMSFEGVEQINLDFSKVNYINSIGVKHWVQWMMKVESSDLNRVTLKCCHPMIVNQVNSVIGFINKKCDVLSFYVPFYSDETSEEKLVLLERDSHYVPATGSQPMKLDLPEAPKDRKGNEMELDVIEEKYFRFLQFNT